MNEMIFQAGVKGMSERSELIHFTIYKILQLSVFTMCPLPGGQGKPFDLREKVLFLCIVGLGRYTRQPNDSPAIALVAD